MRPKDVIRYQLDEELLNAKLVEEILLHEQQAAALNLVIYNFFRFVIRKDGQPNWEGFDSRGEVGDG